MGRKGSMVDAAKKFITLDGWQNVLTGLGFTGRDKRMGAQLTYNRISAEYAEQLYAGDDIAAAIIDTLPEDALRQWFTVSSNEGIDHAVDTFFDSLHLNDRLSTAWKWARLYGGAGILINVDDSRDLSDALKMDQVREIKSLTVLTCNELVADVIDTNLESPRFEEPITYQFNPRSSVSRSGTIIHHSRILPFYGVKLPSRQHIRAQYWGDSVLTRVENAIRNYNISHDAVATILQEFNQGVFTMKGLADMLLAGEDEAVQKRLQTIQLARSVCRAVIIDEDEKFENITASLAGIPETLGQVGQRLVVASRMPHTKILGESPSGLGATGEHELTNWYDFVSNQQELVLRPKINYLLEILFRSTKGPTGGKLPSYSFEFRPLYQPSEKEQVETRKIQAETDAIYIDRQVLDPEEVASSRFGSGKYSLDTVIDNKSRREIDDEVEE